MHAPLGNLLRRSSKVPAVKNDVPEGWNILFESSCNAEVLACTMALRRDTLAPVSTSAVLDRLLELEQPDVEKVLFTILV